MRIQNTEDGSARKIIASLHPKHAAMKPNVNEPHMAPSDVMAATHEICSDLENSTCILNNHVAK